MRGVISIAIAFAISTLTLLAIIAGGLMTTFATDDCDAGERSASAQQLGTCDTCGPQPSCVAFAVM